VIVIAGGLQGLGWAAPGGMKKTHQGEVRRYGVVMASTATCTWEYDPSRFCWNLWERGGGRPDRNVGFLAVESVADVSRAGHEGHVLAVEKGVPDAWQRFLRWVKDTYGVPFPDDARPLA